ncbi:MAG: hypothetical protein NVS4B5_02050 [Vulcanimicrobiaceae bacterium]
MFAPLAKAHTYKGASTNKPVQQRSAFETRPSTDGTKEQASKLTEKRSLGHDEQAGSIARKVTRACDGWDFSKILLSRPDLETRAKIRLLLGASGLPNFTQPKLAVGVVHDPLENEANRIADRVMHMPVPKFSFRAAPTQWTCGVEEQQARPLQTKVTESSAIVAAEAPDIVHEVLRSPGHPLDAGTRSFMESRFGHDFSEVRVHSDAEAAESAAAVNALAYTVGSDIVLGQGQYAPDSVQGRLLLAHEMTHVIQQRSRAVRPQLQRFAASETAQIAPTFSDMLTQIKQLIDAASRNGHFDWDFFVEIAGGTSAGRQIHQAMRSKDPTIKSRLFLRYLFTCRCGLIDMRHFLQLLYISNFATAISQSEASGNRAATNKGREHELTAESNSRFGAEDTPSNALGAATNLSLPGLPDSDTVFDAIKDTLTRCDPIGWSSLSAASKDQIVHFYGDLVPDPKAKKPGDRIPKNQNETAVPDILLVNECGGRERSLPFSLDDSDSDRKTFSGKNFLGGSTSVTSASDIHDFLTTQRPEIIKGLSTPEKLRFVKLLFKGYVSDTDIDGIEIIYTNSSTSEKTQIKSAIDPNNLWDVGQRTRLRIIFS